MLSRFESSLLGIITGLVIFVSISGISKAAYSIVWTLGGVSTGWILWQYLKNKRYRHLQIKLDPVFLWGCLLFWGLIFVSSLLVGDVASIKWSIKYPLLATIGYIVYLHCQFDSGKKGALVGMIGAVVLIFASALYGVYVRGDVRALAYFGTPNSIGKAYDMVFPILLYFFCFYKEKWIRICLGCATVISAYTLYLSASRGAILATAVMAMIALFIRYVVLSNYLPNIVKYSAIVLLGFSIYYGVIEYVEMMSRSYDMERVYMAISSYYMWKDHMWAGVGLLNWGKEYYASYMLPQAMEQGLGAPHNIVVYYLSTTGIVGFIGFTSFQILQFWIGIKTIWQNENKGLGIMWIWLVGAVFLHGLVDYGIMDTSVYKEYFATLGILLALSFYKGSYIEADKKKKE